MKKSVIILIVLTTILNSTANNIQVLNTSVSGQNYDEDYCFIDFSLAWENSWRTSAAPYNWDAAWIFMKFRVPGGEWQHLNPCTTGFSGPPEAIIDIPADSSGAFIHRSMDGSGPVFFMGLSFRWNYGEYGVADDAAVELKVFAIEMVYVPEGPFYIGDTSSSSSFYEAGTPIDFYYVDGSTITIGTSPGNLYASGDIGSGLEGHSISSSYPTGYNAYYCMKYELSQEQYVDFLNCLTRTQQNERTEEDVSITSIGNKWVMVSGTSGRSRNSVSCPMSGLGTIDPINFFCDYNDNDVGNEYDDGMNIACNYVSWMDLAAYADWVGLRPMTEGEFEKACRGPNDPVPGEYAWGNTALYSVRYTLTDAGYEVETITNMGEFTGNTNHFHTSVIGDVGPLRCGIFAGSAMMDPHVGNTRMETGGSYYGIMEMSGNLSEQIVSVLNLAGLSFQGHHGNGNLLADGNADVDYWPGINGNTSGDIPNTQFLGVVGIDDAGGSGTRGGNFVQIAAKVSARTYGISSSDGRGLFYGIRLVRTAP